MSNLPEEILSGFVSQLAYNIASHLSGNDVNRLRPRLMFNSVEGFVPEANSEGVIRGSVFEVVANGVMGDGGSVSVVEVVGSGGMVGENVGNGVNESVQEVLDNGTMVNGVGRFSSQVVNNVSGLVPQVNDVAGSVMENGFVGEVGNGVIENGVSGASVRAVNNGVVGASSSSLGDVANGVMGNGVGRVGARVMNNGDAGVREDIARLREYRSIANGLRVVVRRRRHRIDRLEAVGDSHEAADIIRFEGGSRLLPVSFGGILDGITKLYNCCTFLFAASVKELDHVRNNIIAGKFLNFLIHVEMKYGDLMVQHMHMGNCKCHPGSNKALLTFLVVVSELVAGIDGVSEETPSVTPIDAANKGCCIHVGCSTSVPGVSGVIGSEVTVNAIALVFQFVLVLQCGLHGMQNNKAVDTTNRSVLNGIMFHFFSAFMSEHLSLKICNDGCKDNLLVLYGVDEDLQNLAKHLRESVYKLLIYRRPLLDDYKKGKKFNDLQLIMCGSMA
nr:hypothetical protein [Tanacetum cinerariifolium]